MQSNQPLTLAGTITSSGSSVYISPMEYSYNGNLAAWEYYPRTSADLQQAVGLMLLKPTQSGDSIIRHGDTVQVQTLETLSGGKYNVNSYNRLGAWSTAGLYYYAPGTNYTQEAWTIEKVGGVAGDVINYGDWFTLTNNYGPYSGQGIAPYDGNNLTTTQNAQDAFQWQATPVPMPNGAPVNAGDVAWLYLQDGRVLGGANDSSQPELVLPAQAGNQATSRLIGAGGLSNGMPIQHGSQIQFQSTTRDTNGQMLGAWKAHYLYYSPQLNEGQQVWTVQKLDLTNGPALHYGDAFRLLNNSWHEYMQPDQNLLTTVNSQIAFWYFGPGNMPA